MVPSKGPTTAEQDQRIADTIRHEEPRLRRFVRARVADADDVEDILPSTSLWRHTG